MPSDNDRAVGRRSQKCKWVGFAEALKHFAVYDGPTQSQQHIKPLHWYVACRLVLEGGFHPDGIKPRPPFNVTKRRDRLFLHFAPESATGGEATILGGLKTKSVDIVVDKPGIGPVLAVSCKGMTGAFRNLTNRMEETIGECTNLHIRYPALVFGYLFVIRANRDPKATELTATSERTRFTRRLGVNDIAIAENNRPLETIIRFHAALRELTGRDGIRADPSRYEAISLVMVDMRDDHVGNMLEMFPPYGSPLHFERFFNVLYRCYDERNVTSAPDLAARNRRLEWSSDSPAFQDSTLPRLDYDFRLVD